MGRFLFPIILIGLAVTAFFTYVDPTYAEVKTLQSQYQEYDKALQNSKELKERMAALAGKRTSISNSDLDRLEKLLPDSVNNVRLILDMTELGKPIGITVNNVVFEVEDKNNGQKEIQTPGQVAEAKKDYGTFNISFSITGNYENFVSFMNELDRSLRLIDVSSIAFNATNEKNVYRYDFKIKTYWLK